ncbi:MAG: VacJ family lipoprotein [Verrucomicrobiota bacterium]
MIIPVSFRRIHLLPMVLLGVLAFSDPAHTASATKATSSNGKSVASHGSPASDNDLDEYKNTGAIPDPIQPVNRGTFWVNHQLYRYILKPISRTYDTLVPKPVRTGVYNVCDNLEFPLRFVNDTLQLNLKRAGGEAEKFGINSTVGLLGIFRVSDRFPSLADIPAADTGQTFAKWGIPHGCYVVLPFYGPKSIRDTVGLAGDYALSPIFWVSIWLTSIPWVPAVTAPDSVRSLHDKLSTYESLTNNSMDRYLAVRSAWVQYRKKVADQ